MSWNVGGVDEVAIPQALKDLSMPLAEDTIFLLQEVPRREAGWHSDCYEGWPTLSFRHEDIWRGTGILYRDGRWKIVRRVSSGRGTWFRLRHVLLANEVWVGTIHLDPGCTQIVHRAAADEHLSKLKPTNLPVILACDVNSPIKWERAEQGDVQAYGKDGKTVGFLESMASRELRLAVCLGKSITTPLQADPGRKADKGNTLTASVTKGPRSHILPFTWTHTGA